MYRLFYCQVFPHFLQCFLSDSFYVEQLFHRLKLSDTFPVCKDSFSNHFADTGNGVQLFSCSGIEVDRENGIFIAGFGCIRYFVGLCSC